MHEFFCTSVGSHRIPNILSIETLPNNITLVKFYFENVSLKNERESLRSVKVRLHEGDEDNLETAVFFALSKFMFGKWLTWEGVEHMALYELQYDKRTANLVKKAVKTHYQIKKMLEKMEQENKDKDAAAIRRHEKQVAKKKARKERLEAAAREKRIEEMTEAIKRANVN